MATLLRIVLWQLRARISNSPWTVPWIGNSKLVLERGATGLTGNYYAGLHEFSEMAFLLHLLRGNDLFVDIGANAGSYTVLAGAVNGARVIAFEPGRRARMRLQRHVEENAISDLVTVRSEALNEKQESLRFSEGQDTVNAVQVTAGRAVPGIALDDIDEAGSPTALKIDVEGWEVPVLRGARSTLKANSLLAIIVETNGSGKTYGYDDSEIHELVSEHGFFAVDYDPFTRSIMPTPGPVQNGNTLYIRSMDRVVERVKQAMQVVVCGSRL